MGSMKPMSLRNGKIKCEPFDSDDDYEPLLKSRCTTRNSINNLQTIKLEPDDNDGDADYVDETYKPEPFVVDRVLRVRQPKAEVSKQSDESDYSDSCDDVLPLNLNLMCSSVSNLSKKPLKTIENVDLSNQKQQQKKKAKPKILSTNQTASVPVISAFPIECDEKRSYCCYLCGKTFQHLCRLMTHMPSHTNKRRYHCSMCGKRYKSSSSLNVHKNHCHLGKPRKSRKSRSRSTTSKKAEIRKCVVKIPIIKLKNEYGKFVEVKMEPIDKNVDNEMDLSMELDPLEIHEHVPFVWDECDTKLALPTDAKLHFAIESLELLKTEQKVDEVEAATGEANPSYDETECMSTDISKVKIEKISPLITTPHKMEPQKLRVWQKEAADPLAMHVDILRMPKPKRILFPVESDASHTAMKTEGSSSASTSTTGNRMKSAALAEKFRAFGDCEFIQKNWAGARQWYNRSLCHAEQTTAHFSTAYAKRAQSFFNEGMFRTCWTDLMLSQNSGLPEALLPQLERHKQSCKIMIEQHRTRVNQPISSGLAMPAAAIVQPALSFPANQMFVEMASALQIDCNEYGRYLCARQSIAVGQILIIETGLVATTTSFYEKCCICLTADTNLVPCSRCTRALLCKNCVNGWFHRIECELQVALEKNGPDLDKHPWLGMVLRSFLIAINLFENVDEMMEFVDDAITNSHMASIVNQRSKYRAFLQLTSAPIIQPELIPIVQQLHTTLLNHPAIGSKFSTMKYQRFAAHLLVHHICVINAFTLKVGSAVCENALTEIVAPISSYLKHSCSPNVSKFLLGKSVIVVAMRPIEPGELLFASYCDVLKATIDRQNYLQTQFGFQCRCERCQSMIGDQQIQTFHCNAAEAFVRQNFVHLTSNDQIKRKQLADCVVDILQQFGRMPWNYTIGWAYVVFSFLLSHRFQKKLLY